MIPKCTSPTRRQSSASSSRPLMKQTDTLVPKDDASTISAYDEKRKKEKRSSVQLCTLVVAACLLVGFVKMFHLRNSHVPIGRHAALTSNFNKARPNAVSRTGCSPDEITVKRVIIVGAGAAGLTAAKRLQNAASIASSKSSRSSCWTVQVTILEATSRFGGRVGKDESFTTYPLDIGASWVYDESRLSLIAQEPGMKEMLKDHLVQIFRLEGFHGHKLTDSGMKKMKGSDGNLNKLWSNYTWYDFFEQKVASALQEDQFVFDCPVDRVIHRRDKGEQGEIAVFCGDRVFSADHVILTSSLQVLKDGLIDFQPSLPAPFLKGRRPMYRGFKIFLEFSEKFFSDYLEETQVDGELEWWDYSLAHMKREGPNIFSGYYMGDVHDEFEGLSETEVVKKVLGDLDVIYGNRKATNHYVRHKLVNWKDFPYVRGTYSRDFGGDPKVLYGGRLLIAGEAFPVPHGHNGWVDGAALSGLHAAEKILKEIDPHVRWFSIPKSVWEGY